MPENEPMPMRLVIAECQMDLQVIHLAGRDALNEAYRFEVDLISKGPAFDLSSMPGRTAFLSIDVTGAGVHGRVDHVTRVYAGECLSHYRLALVPEVQRLAVHLQRRVHHNVSVPHLITRLLEQPGSVAIAHRFDQMIGVYPERAQCIQYDESDWHLLQRLCEEEGIHFRFEHTPDRHTLVFSDDSASFPERSPPLRPSCAVGPDRAQARLIYLAEQLSGLTVEQIVLLPEDFQPEAHESLIEADGGAADSPRLAHQLIQVHPQEHADPQRRLSRQRSVRGLERMRCRRRCLDGGSTQPTLASGQIIQVLDHPAPLLNDQWLLTEVRHTGTQLAVLEGFDPHEIAEILKRIPKRPAIDCEPASVNADHYTNHFRVIPWAAPFRPALKHPKTAVHGQMAATLMPLAHGHGATGLPERLAVRFDWQAPLHGNETGHSSPGRWPLAQVALSATCKADQLVPGARVSVRHLNQDPERPVIHALLPPPDTPVILRFHLDAAHVEAVDGLKLGAGQRLSVEAEQGLTLRCGQKRLRISPEHITVVDAHSAGLMPAGLGPPRPHLLDDLRLTEKPGLQGRPLAHRVWYIVRMRVPGLQHLARLAPEHILFEGKTDAQGYLGLSETQRHQLSLEHERSPQALCLVHPGQCLTLRDYFLQAGTQQQRKALAVSNP